MLNIDRKINQIQDVIELSFLKKETLKNQIYQINTRIDTKKVSIERFEEYAKDYSVKCDTLTLKNIQIIKNNHDFYQNLARVIQSEQRDLQQLEAIKKKLVLSYYQHEKKTEGLDTLFEAMNREKNAIMNKIDESILFENALIQGRRKL